MAPPDVLSSQGRRQTTAHAGDAVFKQRLTLRHELLQRRLGLSPDVRRLASLDILQRLCQWRPYLRAQRIASYISVGSEMATSALNDCIVADSKLLYLPSLSGSPTTRMRFRRCVAESAWVLNRFAIPEPAPIRINAAINPAFLDIIFVPLAGFDAQGNRLGMGAGYYDRALAFRRTRRHWKRPLLVGLAYACQQAESIPAARWDVPLDAIVTEHAIITPQ